MSDDEEEVVEMMDVEEAPPVRKPRRVPRRAASSDGGIVPTRRGPARARSTNVAGLRQQAAMEVERKPRVGRVLSKRDAGNEDATMKEVPSAAVTPKRRIGRSKSGDGVLRLLPGRTKSSAGGGMVGTGRSAPRRTASGLGGGRMTPRRTKSSDGSTRSLGGLRKGKKKDKAGATEHQLNIFGSDMVSTDQVILEIEQAKDLPNLSILELEDFFMAEREDSAEIAESLASLFDSDDFGHVWEQITFTDDIVDGGIYGEFIQRKRKFQRAMRGVFEKRLIPVTYKAKITLSSGSLSMDEMVELLFYLRSDKSVVELILKSEAVDESIIRGLTELFKADKRKWESVTMQMSGSGPGKPGSPEHTAWAKEMQTATQAMQLVCTERGIRLG